jgi:hypothetical protein
MESSPSHASLGRAANEHQEAVVIQEMWWRLEMWRLNGAVLQNSLDMAFRLHTPWNIIVSGLLWENLNQPGCLGQPPDSERSDDHRVNPSTKTFTEIPCLKLGGSLEL